MLLTNVRSRLVVTFALNLRGGGRAKGKKVKVSSYAPLIYLQDCSERFTVYPLTDLFNRTPS